MWAFVIFIPATVMRTFSEEKRLNTIEVLLSLPVSEVEIVLAKFLSNMMFVVVGLVLTLGVPATLYSLARIYLPEIIVGYLGCLCIGASFVSVGMFFSSTTKNQIVSLLGTLMALLVLVSLSVELITSLLPPVIKDVLSYLSPVYHLQTFMKGIVDVRSFFYFAGITVLFLFLTVMQIEKRD
jgi:ABC-2 type transport system permease protein